jgi:hypothetical protein
VAAALRIGHQGPAPGGEGQLPGVGGARLVGQLVQAVVGESLVGLVDGKGLAVALVVIEADDADDGLAVR